MTFQEIRARADRARGLPLQSVLLATGAEPDRFDKAKWHTAQGVISVTGMKFMNWDRGVGGGGAIDLTIHLNGMGFKDAVEWLWRRFPGPDSPGQAQSGQTPCLRLPSPDAAQLWRVKRYLVRDRGLSPVLIERLIQSGRLCADNRANAVFLLLGMGNTPVGAELRGTGPRSWRGLAPGSRKDLGYFSVHADHGEGIILCESAIDAISCFMIHPRHRCISTAGARPNPLWLAPLIRQGSQVHCGFDVDPTGESMARAMIALHPTVRRLRPSEHDWNDVLRSTTI
ncbi:MAG: DUF3991 and TOPRIM domain-containing protein [Pseudomonadota bacterium]